MTLPSIDGFHYVGCHCNDICACSDPIECIHEQCICDRLSAAYQRGREDAAKAVEALQHIWRFPLTQDEATRRFALDNAADAARGDGEQG